MAEVQLEIDGGVAAITLNAPERRNAFIPSMVEELLAICDQVDDDETVGAVVIKANGESFCAGAHRAVLAQAGSDPTLPRHFKDLGVTYQAFVRVGELKPPTIAAVRGHAVGAGLNLVLATDLRVVAERARLIAGFLGIGLHPGGGHFLLLSRLAGREAAAAISIFGQEIDGRRAAELGLAWEAVPEAEGEPRAFALAQNAAKDPELARLAVASLRMEAGPPALTWPAALEAERGVQMWSLRRRVEKGQA